MLEEEIEKNEKRAKEKKNRTVANAASRNAAQGADQLERNSFEARFLAGAVERAEGRVTREIAAKFTDLIVHPQEDVVANPPDQHRARYESEITENRQEAKRVT